MLSVEELAQRLDADELTKAIERRLSQVIRKVINDVMAESAPQLWAALPVQGKNLVYQRIENDIPNVVHKMVDDFQHNVSEILDIKDFEEIDSVRELDDICQSLENKAIVAQKELNKKFKGKNIIDFQIYNIQLVEKSFSKIDKDDRKVIGESMDEHLTILSKKGKTFKEPINKVKSNFDVKDFKYKSIKKILKNEDCLKKLLVTDTVFERYSIVSS